MSAIDKDPALEGLLYQPSGGWPSPTATKVMSKDEARILLGAGGIIPPDGEGALIRSQDIRRGWAALGIAAAGLVLFGFSAWWGFF